MSFGMVALSDAATYYIDYSSGSDSNNGQSESSAWQRAPGMNGFAGSYSHVAGDQFIFKGGVTWPNSVFTFTPIGGGNSSVNDYYGVDKTWFTGSSWARPIFNSQGATVGTNDVEIFLNVPYVTIDNLEFTGHYWNGASYNVDAQNATILNGLEMSQGVIVENCYFHGWSHAPYNSGANPDSYNIVEIGQALSNIVENNVFTGFDGDAVSGCAIRGAGFAVNNIIYDVSNGILGCIANIIGNTIYDINDSYDPTQHENSIEAWLCQPGAGYTQYIYNNVIHDTSSGAYFPIDPGFGNNTSPTTAYLYNNVYWNSSYGDLITLDPSGTNPALESIYIWNNTIVTGSGYQFCFRMLNRGIGNLETVSLQNNNCISNQGLINIDSGMGANTYSANPNLVLGTSTAAADGYTIANAFAPTSSTSPTVGQGWNLSSNCSTNPALCSDTTLGVSYDAINHVVIGPGRTAKLRPTISAWDIGAYQYAASAPISETTPGLNAALVYPDPVTPPYNPTFRVCPGGSTSGGADIGVTIFDVSGRAVNSSDAFNFIGVPTQGVGVNQFECYEYTWTGHKASGIYFAVVHAKGSGTTVKAKLKFAVVR